MRPTTKSQSALFQPLTHALGTEARVRLLRVLAAAQDPIGVPALAEAAALNERGTRKVLRELEELGAVTRVPGAGQQVVFRETWPLAGTLRQLFAAEAEHTKRVLQALRRAAQSVTPPPIGVWIAGPHAAGADTPIDPLLIVCYGNASDLPAQTARLTHTFTELSKKYDLPAPEVRALARDDVELAKEAGVEGTPVPDERLAPPLRLLAGTLPALPWLTHPRRAARTHADHDAALAQLAETIADLLRRSPDLVPRAREALEARRATAPKRLRPTLDEWAMLLDTQPPARLAALLRRDDERMRRLRQSLPFVDVLTPSERAEVDAAVAMANESADVAPGSR